MQRPTLSVIILAGGRSQRMGTDKALLKSPDGTPLIARTIQVARELTEDVGVVEGVGDRYQSALSPKLTTQVHFVPEQTAKGPLHGFALGWTQTDADWCLLLACDLPYLESQPLQEWWVWLISHQASQQSLASLVQKSIAQEIARSDIQKSVTKKWEPLCGFYHRRSLPSLTRYLSDHNLRSSNQRYPSFQGWLAGLSIAAYTAFPQAMLFNCNTPADWAEARRNIF